MSKSAEPDWDERIELAMARIISSLLDVVTQQHDVNAELYRQIDALTVRVERLESRPS